MAEGKVDPEKERDESAAESPSEAEADSSGKAEADSSGKAEADSSGDAEPAKNGEGDKSDDGKKEESETWINTMAWVLGIVLVLGVELFIYGHNGFIRVCVGVDTLTDYSLKTEPRSRENAKNHPFCAQRLNLGMWTSSDDLAKESLQEACTMAARVVGQEHKEKCLRKDQPWTREVEMEHVMPWDPRLYRKLLFLD